MYNIMFDSVVYNNQSLALKNFRIEPSTINTDKAKKFFSIPDFELVNLSISELISNKRLKADRNSDKPGHNQSLFSNTKKIQVPGH
jgi:hypothetical protein